MHFFSYSFIHIYVCYTYSLYIFVYTIQAIYLLTQTLYKYLYIFLLSVCIYTISAGTAGPKTYPPGPACHGYPRPVINKKIRNLKQIQIHEILAQFRFIINVWLIICKKDYKYLKYYFLLIFKVKNMDIFRVWNLMIIFRLTLGDITSYIFLALKVKHC